MSCPKKMLGDDIMDFLDRAAFAAEGLPPEAGGANQQTKSFMQALRFYRDEENALKARE